jgi:AmiR/NasT family two-component response regulator
MMGEQRLVALYGDNLLMDTVEASLAGNKGLGLIRIHTTVNDVAERLKALSPDLVIFDMNDPNSWFVFALPREQPRTFLLCLDITQSKVIALNCQQFTALTADDLAEVIQLQTAKPVAKLERSNMTLFQ